MKKLLLMLLACMLSVCSLNLSAQGLEDYGFSTGTDASKWIPLTTTTSLISAGAGDYGVSTVQNLGFTFFFGETSYTQFSVNADGNLRFGSTVTGTSNYSSPFNSSNAAANNPKINMMGCDGFLTDSGYVHYELTGTAPNRVGVIEFATSTYTTTSRNSLLRWQVQLFEGSNNIQVVFASTTPPILPAVTRQCGLCIDGTDVILIDANHIATHYNAGQATTIASGQWPDVNRYYLFSYPSSTCPKPYNFAVESVSSDEVTLTWSPRGSESSWDIFFTDQAIAPDEYTTPTTSVFDTTYTEYSLTPSTTYYAYVRANCGSEFSNWASLSFSTTCVPLTTLPLTMDFESEEGLNSTTVTADQNNLPLCWDHLCGTYSSYAGYPFIYNNSTYAASGTNAMRFYTSTSTTDYGNQYAILPAIDLSYYTMNNLQISMDVRKNSTSYTSFTLYVGVMTDASNPASFVPVDTLILPNTTYENHIVYFTNYEGLGNRIALMAPRIGQSGVSYNTGYVDNIIVEPIPTCIKPTNVTLSNITDNSVDVNWIPGAEETAWEVAVVEHGDDIANALVEYAYSHPYTFGNLTDDTQYDVYVRADCGGGDYSSWTFAQTFTTNPLCSSPGAVTISQIAGASALVSWESAPYGALDYTVEYSEAGQNNWTQQIVTGTSCLLSGLEPLTSYDVRVSTNCAQSSADPSLGSFTTGCLSGGSITIGEGTATNYYIPVNNYYKYTYSQQIYLASEMNGPSTITSVSFQYAYASPTTSKDSVKIYLGHTTKTAFTSASDYEPFNNLQLVYTGNLNCTQGWNTFYFNTPFQYNGTDNLIIAVDDNSYAFDGSSYTFYVHAAGSYRSLYYYSDSANPDPSNPTAAGANSSYSSGNRSNIKFGGACDSLITCIAPNVYVSEKTSSSITLDWVPGYNESSWNLEYSTDNTNWTSEGSVSAPYTLTGLSSDTPYSIRIQSDCGNGETSNWVVLNTRTECSSVTIPYFENFDSAPASGAGNMITCWTRNTNYSTAYPYTSSTQKHSGDYSVYFYGSTSYYSYLASPCFDDQVQINDLQIQFWAYKTTASYYIEYGVMSDPNDYNTFVSLGQISPSATSTWEMFEVNTSNYTGNGHYIAFRIPVSAASYMYIDDINIDNIPVCLHVENVHAVGSSITETSADITWTPGDEETEWEYVYGPAGTISNPELETSDFVYGTPTVSLSGLTGNTLYDVFVRAICSGSETSTWMTGTFRTACSMISTLPFIENFDTYGTGNTAYMDCWSKLTTYTLATTLPYISTPGADNTTAHLYFYTATAGTYNMAIMPPIDVNVIPMNTLRATFKYKANALTDRMVVGVLEDPSSDSTFVPVDTIVPTSTGDWLDVHVDFINYTGNGSYIGFMNTYNVSNTYGRIDNLVVNLMPDCLEPDPFIVSTLGQTDATLSWSPRGSETEWEVTIVPAGAPMAGETPTVVSMDTFLYVSNLNANSSYDAYIRSICAGNSGYSDYAVTHFTTLCAFIDSIPFSENFDGIPGATSTTVSVSNLPTCWNNISGTYSSYAGYPAVYESSTYAASGSNSLRFYTGTSTSTAYGDEYAILPPMDVNTYPLNTLQLTMDIRKNSTTYTDFTLIVGVMSNPEDVNSFVALDTITETSTTYNNHTVYFTNYTGAGNCIAFYAPRISPTGVSYNTGYVDNVVVDFIPSCPKPGNVTASSVTANSITLSWVEAGTATAWTIEYGAPGFTPGNNVGTVEFVNTNPYTISNLTANTLYEFYIKSDCGGGDESDWSVPYSVRTACDAITTLPFEDSFDTYGTGSSVYPSCWSKINTYSADRPYINTTNYSAPGAMYFYAGTSGTYNIAITPIFDASISINTLQATFMYKGSGSNDRLIIGVISNPMDASTFVPVDTVYHNAAWTEHEVVFNNYTGTGQYIAFKNEYTTTTGYAYLDNLRIETIPTCVRPRDVVASAVTTSSVTLSWNEIGSATQWNIEYGPTGFTQGSGTTVIATSNPFTITGLNASTNYSFYVQSDCGGGDVSPWSNVLNAGTECDVTTLPYTENFDSYAGTTYNTPGPTPLCWTNTTTNTTYPAPHVTSSGSYWYPHSGTNCLVFTCSSAGADAYAVLPTFDQPLNTLHLNFYRQMESTTYGTLTVGYVTSSSNTSSFVTVATITSLSGTGDTISVDFTGANIPANGNIAFHWYQGSTFYSCCIDDINVTQADTPGPGTTCDAPTNVAASNIAQTTATITWTPSGDETSWNLQYKAASSSSWSSNISVNNNASYTLTGLTANTAYQVRVQAVCDANNVSDWANGTFTTLNQDEPTCPAPTNVAANDITKNSAVITWSQEPNTATSWTVLYKQTVASSWETATANTMTYTLSGLIANTQYDVQVMANCDNGMQSAASETIHFTTLVDGVNNYVLDAAFSVYPNPTNGLFTISNDQNIIREVSLFDVYGKIISTTKVDDTHVTLDINTCANGTYFARVITDNGVVTKRIVKK